MDIITLDLANIDSEHLCCALADKKSEEGVQRKKEWLKERFNDGHVFKKLNVRGKVFIEYVPSENAWCPIEAPGYLFISCFWVSGSFKGKGYGNALFEECVKDAKNKNGIVVLVGKSKKPFLSDKRFFIQRGFEVCDAASPYFELLVKKFKDAPMPLIKDCAKKAQCENKEGLTVYYTAQCPYTCLYIEEAKRFAEDHRIPLKAINIKTKEEAQNLPVPFANYSVFYHGKFVTHEILTRSKLESLLAKVR
ncbi:MAG: N-acetyltransferase [Clostridia bacterium]|nr:N-acetyltransferase [Clostridia bacterium]